MNHYPVTLFLVLVAILTAPSALARQKTPSIPSATERQGKDGTWDYEPASIFIGDHSGIATGGSLGVYLSPDQIVRATYRTSKSCLEVRCSYVDDALSLTVQQFVANSFFVEIGLAEQVAVEHPVDSGEYDSISDRDSAFTYRVETRGFVFSIGNQWQWKSFTLGARWGMDYQPLQVQKASVTADRANEYPAGPNERRHLVRLGKEGKLFIPSLMIGTSF